MGLIDQIKNALGLGPPTPTFGPPMAGYVPPRPRPIPVPLPPQGLPTNPSESAGLVTTVSHVKGRDSSASLVGGR